MGDVAHDLSHRNSVVCDVAIVFSSEGPRRRYLGAKPLIDRLAAGVIGVLGVKLIAEVK